MSEGKKEAVSMRMRALPVLAMALVMLLAGGIFAAYGAQPEPWQMNLQPPASPVDDRMHAFHNLLLVIITAISVFVLALLLYTCWRFAEKRNEIPSRRSHHTVLEIVWTAVPVLILVIIAIPSFRLLYYVDVVPPTEMTLKVVGHQWYWSYEYPDHGNFSFDANMVQEGDLQPGQPRLLQTDNLVVLPVETSIKVQITAADVIHSWGVPSMGFTRDAVPGRLNETWIRIEKPGMYYGQCRELCGDLHAFMPVSIKAVPKEEFLAWTEAAKQQFASAGGNAVVADAASVVAPQH
ncbi:MAG TPA: cytochrome c oxidase subunit II [Geminicoccus sp.]|jgi:cytochrome c oxidase subunit 2|uniref:cytochrome c oxidase subunit II n=1 Tax=Geminicoccus sp. TaxID=2024832 RepID=UPI002E32F581|nr:cytochrome c oxidase subunit II [Geminicoccus sp.]HEX2526121.1 cytochrome c oxidase subunit II [Geminicoccus sp.]